MRFIALAQLKEFWNVMNGEEKAPKESDTGLDADQEKLRIANMKGYNNLLVSCKGKALEIVQNAFTDDSPSGSLKEAWDKLEEVYDEKIKSEEELSQERSHRSRMEKSTEDLVAWYDEQGDFTRRLEAAKKEIKDLIKVSEKYKNLPEEYKPSTTGLYLKLDNLNFEYQKNEVNKDYG